MCGVTKNDTIRNEPKPFRRSQIMGKSKKKKEDEKFCIFTRNTAILHMNRSLAIIHTNTVSMSLWCREMSLQAHTHTDVS